MRRRKNDSRLRPYIAGIIAGYAAALVFAAIGALLVMSIGNAEQMSGVMAIISFAAGSFVCGRISGKIKRKDGLKTGAICGLLYILPLVLLSIIFSVMSGALLYIKLVLCVAFGAAGGVVGVNSVKA